MQIPMATRCLPRDRRDIQQWMVDEGQGNLFAICVKLKLFRMDNVNREAMNEFSRKLFKLVKRRHTHLWNRTTNV